MKVRLHAVSDIGQVREENQDAYLLSEPDDDKLLAERGSLVVVCDGMGGLSDGRVASQMAVEKVRDTYFSRGGTPAEALGASVQEANREIFRFAQGERQGQPMGSTCTALAVLGKSAHIAQVGDSRAYRYHRGKIRQITRDHSLVRELLDRGEIEKGSAQYTFHRNVLTRGLGLREEIDVDLFELSDLEEGDLFFLTSDGLHELVDEAEFVDSIANHLDDLDAIGKELIALANERGGTDNITVGIAAIGSIVSPPASGALSTDTLTLTRDERAKQGGAPSKGCLLPIAIGVVVGLLAGVVYWLAAG